jgi:WD40 repeat protein/energy-coupling factor transporter ATP-binding protein EcfA2
MRASVLSVAQPFVGLRPFEKTDAHLFFGRDVQIEELLARLRGQRFVAVMGTSGSGKSSLIRAGLIPALEGGFIATAGSSWRVAIIRPGGNPIGNLAAALAAAYPWTPADRDAGTERAIVESILRRGSLGLVDAVRESPAADTESLLLVVDQFEELFRFKAGGGELEADDHAAAFVKLLIEAIRQKQHAVHVVLTMRSEFLGDCAEFHDLPELINEGLFLIPRLNRDQLAEAITGPAAVAGARISPGLVQRLLNDVGDDPDQLPVLQHALMRMWDRLRGDPSAGQLTLAHYEAIGGLADALSAHAEEAYGELDEPRRRVAEQIFKSLTERSPENRDVRRPTTVRELCDLADASLADVATVLDCFRRDGRSFLTPSGTQPLGGDTFVDISHESLIRKWTRLRSWVNDAAESRKLFIRLADSAAAHAAGKEPLWRNPQVALALDWRHRANPTDAWARRYGRDLGPALTFLEASQKAEASEHRRALLSRFGWAVAVGVLMLAGGTTWVIYDQLEHAKDRLRHTMVEQQRDRELSKEKVLEARIAREQAELADQLRKASKDIAEAKSREADAKTALAEAAEQKRRDADALRQRLVLNFNRRLNPEGSELNVLVSLRALRLAERAGAQDIVQRTQEALRKNLAFLQVLQWQDRLPAAVTRLATASADLPVIVAHTLSTFAAWDVSSSPPSRITVPSLTPDPKGDRSPVRALALGADGRRVAWIRRDTLFCWDVASRETGSVSNPSFLTARLVLAAAQLASVLVSGDDRTELWSLDTKEATKLLDRTAERAVFSADGRVVATAAEGIVRVWQLASPGNAPTEITIGPRGVITSLAVSRTGRSIAAAFGPRVWTCPVGAAERRPRCVSRLITAAGPRPVTGLPQLRRLTELAFSPDEQLVAVSDISGVVAIFGAASADAVVRPTFSFRAGAEHLAFSDDSRLFAASSNDGSVRIWKSATERREGSAAREPDAWREIGRLFLGAPAQGIAFLSAPDDTGEYALVTGDSTGAVKLWGIADASIERPSTAPLDQQACGKIGRTFTADEWVTYFGTDRYESPCPGLAASPEELLKLQIIYARDGDARAARDAFRSSGSLDLGRVSISQVVSAAVAHAAVGNRSEARDLFRGAVRLARGADDEEAVKARISNDVCWNGAIHDFAPDVLPACEAAVALADDGVRFAYRDSLGVARALKGDDQMALEAFEEYVEKARARRPAELVHKREGWIADLKRGRNPFTTDRQRVLAELRKRESRRLMDGEIQPLSPMR